MTGDKNKNMSVLDDTSVSAQPEKKLRFQSTPKLHYNYDNKVEDLFANTDFKPITKMVDERPEPEARKKDTGRPSLFSFINIELNRGYLLENDEEQYAARREKVYSFMQIPREVEKFMIYGFLQCADSFLYVYTFLPIRFLLALKRLCSRPFFKTYRLIDSRRPLKSAEICDLLKGFIIIICSVFMFYLDTNMLYHMIKSQSVIKLYIFYNMLEVGDRLFSAFGQDIIDALFWTVTEPKDRRREHAGAFYHLTFAIAYVFSHSVLVLFQATTLNVAINSNNKALLTIMMSNNFVELKGSVFKKFDKNNLFQVSCSDVRERFHLFVLLFIVVLQTMKEYSWREERFWILIPDCFLVLFVEMCVDWIKHAFITRFNELQVDVYRDYTTSLAYDMAQTRQKNAFSDHSDLVARRMGFIPLPLGVVMIRVLAHALHIEGFASYALLLVGYLNISSIRLLNNIVILGAACYLIQQHRQEKVNTTNLASPSSSSGGKATTPLASPINHNKFSNNISNKDQTSTPLKSPVGTQSENFVENLSDCTLGVTAIFSNSSVDLKDVCLNDELLRVEREEYPVDDKVEKVEDIDSMSKSVPNIQSELQNDHAEQSGNVSGNLDEQNNVSLVTALDSTMIKRSDSEPLIVKPLICDIGNNS